MMPCRLLAPGFGNSSAVALQGFPPTPTLEEIFEISAPHSHIQGSYFSERGASLKLQELMQSLSLVLCFLKEDFFFNF